MDMLAPVTNVFVMNKGKLMENHCSVVDQEGTAGETASGNPVEVLVECVFGNKVLISLKVFLFLFIIMWSSGDGNPTKEPGIDPGLTEKPDPATEEQGPTTGSTSQGEKETYERASQFIRLHLRCDVWR